MDNYQAVYDAVRSRFSHVDLAEVIRREMHGFDISNSVYMVQQEFASAAHEMQRPSVLYRPELSADGTMWMALLGPNLQEGVAGFGETPAKAMEAFDKAFFEDLTPAAHVKARREAEGRNV